MRYNSLNNYLREKFGKKVYKISIDGGFTCPNRDGTLDSRGCIFCSHRGSGDFTPDKNLSVTQQIEEGKKKVISKIKDNAFIAYFQAFTNTYAPINVLREQFYEAINHKDIVALSIATRPDCVGEEVLSLLKELNKIKPVWVELGLQTTKESSVKYIRRAYDTSVYVQTAEKLKKAGIEVITHIILGLPGESRVDMLNSVKFAGKYTDGIKLQLLHILKGTDLYNDYMKGKFKALALEEYVDIICDCINILPKNVVIHRLTGDGDKKLLVSPLWSGNKKNVLNTINKALEERNVLQGSKA
ncbi:MAG: TIGR01212 family radical SAM protein [Oscillospiraceae bacterium]|nr:TIGR01212 family radical SAM protein [Oscillospiraceae bacterium]